MRRLLIICSCTLLAVSCTKKGLANSDVESNVMLEEPVVKPVDSSANAPGAEGLALIQGGDCLTCHKMDAKLVGPAYQDVAAKYTAADIDMLANKIISGGKGNWGEIPMSAHTGMSKDNAKKMVEYILTLKK